MFNLFEINMPSVMSCTLDMKVTTDFLSQWYERDYLMFINVEKHAEHASPNTIHGTIYYIIIWK